MRRCLPATLLRPLQQSLKPTSVAARRYDSSSSSSAPAGDQSSSERLSEKSQSTRDSSSSSTGPDVSSSNSITSVLQPESLTYAPAQQPRSTASMYRTQPQKVKYRRQNVLLPHPHFAQDIYDPELFDVNRETMKRMPFAQERQFDAWRQKGFFPGDVAVARTHYLEFERLWQARVRGFEYRVWNRATETWELKNRTGFFIKLSQERGLELPQSDLLRDLSMYEAFKAKPDEVVIYQTDLKPAEVKKRLDFDLNVVEFAFNGQEWYFRGKAAEGKEELEWKRLEGRQLTEFNAAVKHIVDWDAVAARTNVDRKIYREELVGYRVYLPNVAIRLVRNATPKDQEYDPYVATFRIPPMMTKHDLRGYLKAVYDLDVTFIRTDIYWGKVKRQNSGQKRRLKGPKYNYKRATVGLYEPFHYPDDVDELRAISRASGRGDELYEKRMDSLESSYFIRANTAFRKRLVQKILKRSTYRYRDAGVNTRGSIVRNILVKKQERENLIRGVAQEMRRRVSQ